jgi:uncharacterized cupredoxin-like copper-binding protein
MVRRYLSILGVVILLGVTLAACGSGDEDEIEPTVTRIPDAANAPVLTPAGSPEAETTEVTEATVPAASPVAGSPVPASPEAETEGGAVTAEDVTVTSIDIAFEPAEVTIPANTDVVFHLTNDGAAPHNFSIDELEISIDQAPGESHDITINAAAGVYEFYCNVPGHREAGMVGTLTVTDGAAEAPVEEAAAEPAQAPGEDTGDEAAATGDEGSGSGEAAAEDVTVTSIDIAFEPAEVTIPGGTDVVFHLPNDGAAPHHFSIDELEISIDQAPGESHDVTINAPPGVYEYYCNVPGHREAGMVGTLTVE